MSTQDVQEINRSKFNLEAADAAHINWRGLRRFFASGAAVFLSGWSVPACRDSRLGVADCAVWRMRFGN
jgi:hypothetical protein